MGGSSRIVRLYVIGPTYAILPVSTGPGAFQAQLSASSRLQNANEDIVAQKVRVKRGALNWTFLWISGTALKLCLKLSVEVRGKRRGGRCGSEMIYRK